MTYVTRLASLDKFEKGGVEVIDDDPKNYAFSNIFEVASHAKPFEQIAVAKNFEYVLEAVRVEGTSGWRACTHDQSALVLDGEVEFTLRALNAVPELPASGSVSIGGDRRPSVLLIQPIEGPDTQFRWAEICQTG